MTIVQQQPRNKYVTSEINEEIEKREEKRYEILESNFIYSNIFMPRRDLCQIIPS